MGGYTIGKIFLSYLGKMIGEGAFGKVRLGVHNLTGENVAIKILEISKV